jgi:hypothetical protein
MTAKQKSNTLINRIRERLEDIRRYLEHEWPEDLTKADIDLLWGILEQQNAIMRRLDQTTHYAEEGILDPLP